MSTGGLKVEIEGVNGVWFRRSIAPSVAPSVDPCVREWVQGEVQHLVEGVVLDPSVNWVNSIEATYYSERKIFQLRLAREIGGSIPKTLVTNKLDAVVEFAKTCEAGVICKPIYRGLWLAEGRRYAVFTRSVGEEDFPTIAELDQCPVLLQERIPRGVDVRVTCVGAQVFAAEIEFDSSESVDWRSPGQDVLYRRSSLPSEVESFCRAMMERLRLQFGAFDFIRSANGEWYFLEINPAGEWAWIEHALGFPICDAIVDLLNYESY